MYGVWKCALREGYFETEPLKSISLYQVSMD